MTFSVKEFSKFIYIAWFIIQRAHFYSFIWGSENTNSRKSAFKSYANKKAPANFTLQVLSFQLPLLDLNQRPSD